MIKQFNVDDRVDTDFGPGSILWKRMRGPEYVVAAVYSVKLDSKKDNPRYSGTIFQADKVKEIK